MKNEGKKKRRRRKGTGGVWKRVCKGSSTQTWVIDYVNEFGKRKVQAIGKKKEDAIKKLNAVVKQVEYKKLQLPANTGPEPITFKDYADKWFKNKLFKKPSTEVSYRDILLKHLIPYFGDDLLFEISREAIQEYMAKFFQDDRNATGRIARAPQTLKNVLRVLGQILKEAKRNKRIIENPFFDIDPLPVDTVEVRPLEPQEIEAILESAKTYYPALYPVVCALLFTGARRGEVLALRWQDIDLPEKKVHVNWSLWKDQLVAPKTKYSRRAIPIGPQLAGILRVLWAEQKLRKGAIPGAEDFVFADRQGRPLNGDNVSHAWGRILKKAKVRKVRLHDTRHTYASMAVAANVNPKVLQRILGHSSTKMTMDLYSHAQEKDIAAAGATIEAAVHNVKIGHSENSEDKESSTQADDNIQESGNAKGVILPMSKSMNTICCHVPKVRRS
jgi:integrase